MNYILDNILKKIEEKNISKKEFALKLINLNPKVGMKSEPPSERTIYLYLQGKRELKADIIPYIAEVLNINEQELFKTNYQQANIVSDITPTYFTEYNKKEKELIELFPYISDAMFETFIKKAKESKKLTLK